MFINTNKHINKCSDKQMNNNTEGQMFIYSYI